MKTKKQKRDEALTRLKEADFTDSKMYRKWINNEICSGLGFAEVADLWNTRRAERIQKLERMS